MLISALALAVVLKPCLSFNYKAVSSVTRQTGADQRISVLLLPLLSLEQEVVLLRNYRVWILLEYLLVSLFY